MRLQLDGEGIMAQTPTGMALERRLNVLVDGEVTLATEDETVASMLIMTGKHVFRSSAELGKPRSVYCGMGLCHECLVSIDGMPRVRACMTKIRSGMRIDTMRE